MVQLLDRQEGLGGAHRGQRAVRGEHKEGWEGDIVFKQNNNIWQKMGKGRVKNKRGRDIRPWGSMQASRSWQSGLDRGCDWAQDRRGESDATFREVILTGAVQVFGGMAAASVCAWAGGRAGLARLLHSPSAEREAETGHPRPPANGPCRLMPGRSPTGACHVSWRNFGLPKCNHQDAEGEVGRKGCGWR